mgnify:CR=1 FL=1
MCETGPRREDEIAVALTSQPPRAGFLLALELTDSKLSKRSWVKISQIRTLSTARLRRRLGRFRPEDVARVVDGLNEIIGGGNSPLISQK